MAETKDIPFNMDYKINKELREQPVDMDAMLMGIDHLKEELENEENQIKRASILSLLGVFSRISGDYIGSENFLKESYEIFKTEKKFLAAFVARLRLGVTYQWKEQYSKSEKIFLSCIDIARNSDDPALAGYEDFALQHLGKCKFDQGLINEALDYFTEAMELRIVKGDLELIKSTEKAIEVVRSFLKVRVE
jgi:tetratricopeptide (TPR) repeat protein